jgi:hypothetical protein
MNISAQLERVRYWQGQLLASIDLQTQMRTVAELRRQHNRAVHGAYGIAIGLTTRDIQDGALALSCGLAYDCSGRELMVPVNRNVPLPSPVITAPHLLILAYDAILGDATLAWQPQGAPVSTGGVALARILPGIPHPLLDDTFRSVIARPLARPHLASGETVRGDTAWESWVESGISVGVQSLIDTSAAGFTTTPNYFAEAVTDNPTADFVPAWFASIADPAPGSFKLRLFMRRITREAFDILDLKSQAANTPSVGGKISLKSSNVFAKGDWVSRLLPIVARASFITALSGTTATIDKPLDPFNGTKQVAFGNPPRLASVTKLPTAATGSEVTVDMPEHFQGGDVVVKLGPNFATVRPTTVASIDDLGELELANPITGLVHGDQLGIAQTASRVIAVSGTTITVQNPALFTLHDIVVCIDDPERFSPAKITNIAGTSNEILTLSPPVSGLDGLRIASVKSGGTVQTVDLEAGEVIIRVDQPKHFHVGDLVAKILPGGIFTEPVRVQSIQSSTKTLTLSKAIAGLSLQDQIGAADFRVRSTVLNVSGGTAVTVANPSLFPVSSLIVRLSDSYVPTGSASVSTSSGNTLGLSAAIDGLKSGDIIALCSFPVIVTVQTVDSEGIIQVTPPGLIKSGDVVASLVSNPGITIVAAASGSSVQLATDIPGLSSNDTLSVVTLSGQVNVTSGTSDTKVTLDSGHRVRLGDFLADIAGWREPGPIPSIAYVIDGTGTDLTLYSQLDGLMVNDTIGLASLSGTGGSWLQLRLTHIPDLTPGDEALLVGFDRLQGRTKSMFANVEFVVSTAKLVYLLVQGASGSFVIRPEDLAASILFVRGSPLALVQNQNLYVSWLACQDPDPMPRPCSDSTASDCVCGRSNQS